MKQYANIASIFADGYPNICRLKPYVFVSLMANQQISENPKRVTVVAGVSRHDICFDTAS